MTMFLLFGQEGGFQHSFNNKARVLIILVGEAEHLSKKATRHCSDIKEQRTPRKMIQSCGWGLKTVFLHVRLAFQ